MATQGRSRTNQHLGKCFPHGSIVMGSTSKSGRVSSVILRSSFALAGRRKRVPAPFLIRTHASWCCAHTAAHVRSSLNWTFRCNMRTVCLTHRRRWPIDAHPLQRVEEATLLYTYGDALVDAADWSPTADARSVCSCCDIESSVDTAARDAPKGWVSPYIYRNRAYPYFTARGWGWCGLLTRAGRSGCRYSARVSRFCWSWKRPRWERSQHCGALP